MQTQILATTFALIFLAIEAIWLITIRNRYVILISSATILFGVQVLSLLIIRDHFVMGNKYFLEYLAKLLLKDILLLLPIWVFFFTPFSFKRVKEILSPILTGFDQLFSGVDQMTKASLVLVSFMIALFSTPLGLVSIIIPLFWPLLIDFPGYLTYSPLYRFLPTVLSSRVGDSLDSIIIGWLLYTSLATTIIRTKRSFWFILYLLFIFLLINNVVGCRNGMPPSM